MVKLSAGGVFLLHGQLVLAQDEISNREVVSRRLAGLGLPALPGESLTKETGYKGTITYQILSSHNRSDDVSQLKLQADALASHDITYVGIIQTARASGLKEFRLPYVLTNCHNSLSAVGGTINEDDHLFGLSAARKYGGIYVPAHLAVIHQYMREMIAGCGKLIIASDSHTRYGALGTMGFGEGGPEIVKQLLWRTYDLPYPQVVAVYLKGKPALGVGPQDVALAIIQAVFPLGFVENKVMEFVGPGIASLSIDFRCGVDVMTTEAASLSSIWQTDEEVKGFYETHGRPEDFAVLKPAEVAYYDSLIEVDLDRVEPMIALPFHPSNVWPIAELNRRPREILAEVERSGRGLIAPQGLAFNLTDKLSGGRLKVNQGIVVGCAGGTFDNITAMAEILQGRSLGTGEFTLSIYPASQPIYLELVKNGALAELIRSGAVIRSAFCGPCFGAGDVPAHQTISIRHATRNFPNREGSIPAQGQLASVALMDARSIAATALRGGILTSATEIEASYGRTRYYFDRQVYDHRVYRGFGHAQPQEELRLGPNIADWPTIKPLRQNLLLKVASVILDPVTTTDELIPSGETSAYRSNPLRLAEFTLARKDPGYVGRARQIQALEEKRAQLAPAGSVAALMAQLPPLWDGLEPDELTRLLAETTIASAIVAVNPGDGSAREQAASCQRILGGQANIAVKYATKRYRSNLINWGILPFTLADGDLTKLAVGDFIYIPGIAQTVAKGSEEIAAFLTGGEKRFPLTLKLEGLTPVDRQIILAGCLMNYYARQRGEAG